MSDPSLRLQCANPTCLHPANRVGQKQCDHCQAPLVYRYLWAIGPDAKQLPVGSLLGDRYWVKSARIWLDTKPAELPEVPELLPEPVLPYLHLYPQRLHLPGLYGFYPHQGRSILLLDNAPIDPSGQLLATLASAWTTVSASRQMYWLWQLWQLWHPLREHNVVASLLIPDNLRVEGWRVRLVELISDWQAEDAGFKRLDRQDVTAVPPVEGGATGNGASHPDTPEAIVGEGSHPSAATLQTTLPPQTFSLADLAMVWLPWVEEAYPSIQAPLRAVCQQMQAVGEPTEQEFQTIAKQLNRILLEQAAQLPLTVTVSGATTTGPERTHNEDSCFPCLDRSTAITRSFSPPSSPRLTLPSLANVGIICDGIGGHEGGEVASKLALDSLQMTLPTLLDELSRQPEPSSPEEIEQQLITHVRIANNLISERNDEQERELRQRMGTTLVMAVQLPQRIATPSEPKNTHELFLVHVGDSRAYWLTPRYCHQLTVDHDVATREVRLGRSPYAEAVDRPDGGALTQALGTRDADAIAPTVQRFVVEESGLLLLCSDGLSDNDRINQRWEQVSREFFQGKLSLEQMVDVWIDIANQQNGHDNTSVVLLEFQVGDRPQLPDPTRTAPLAVTPPTTEWTEASKELLEQTQAEPAPEPALPEPAVSISDPVQEEALSAPPASRFWLTLVGWGILAFLLGIGLVVLFPGPLGLNNAPSDPPTDSSPSPNPSETD